MPFVGVNDRIEALGLKTYGREREDPNVVVRRAVFEYKPVKDLYTKELPALYGQLLRDEGTSLDRDDPKLFDKELDNLLQTFGPKIWPRPGHGSRDHLREPKKGTRYASALVYPRDSAVLKQHLRGVVLLKQNRRGSANIDALIEKRSVRRWKKKPKSAPVTPAGRLQSTRKAAKPFSARSLRRLSSTEDSGSSSGSDDDSVLGTQTRGQTLKKTSAESNSNLFQVELRLYRVTSSVFPPVWSLGNVFMDGDATSNECFSRISEQIESDCSWIIFQLPEDLSREAKVRIERGTRGSEIAFQHVLDLFRHARNVRNEPSRSVEVEVGLDLGANT